MPKHSMRNRRAAAQSVVVHSVVARSVVKATEPVPAALQPWTPFIRQIDFPPRFPSGLVRPQPLGAAITTMPWPAAVSAPAPEIEAAKQKPVTPRNKRAPKAKRAKKPGLNTKAKTTAKAASKASKSAKLRVVSPPEQVAGPPEPAILRPRASEPLVSAAAPAPDDRTPLPRAASLAPYRKGGFLALITFWLRDTGRWMTGSKARPKKRTRKTAATRPAPRPNELALLRAENERLRLQLEALMAMRAGGQATKEQDKSLAAVL